MRTLHFHIENLKLRLTGCAPETAQRALDGLDREMERRLQRRHRSFFSQGAARQAPEGFSAVDAVDVPDTVVDSRVSLDAAGLRSLIADHLLSALEMPPWGAVGSPSRAADGVARAIPPPSVGDGGDGGDSGDSGEEG